MGDRKTGGVELDRNLYIPLSLAGGAFALILGVIIFAPGSFLAKMYLIHGAVCPQRADHSYFFEGVQLPAEARMLGIFGGFMLAWFILWFIGRGRDVHLPPRPITLALAIFVLLMVLDGLNATFWDAGVLKLYQPQNWLRLITGTLYGIAMAAFILPIYNKVVWKHTFNRPAIRHWRELSWLTFGVVAGLGLITLSGWTVSFWVLTLVSTLGLIAMLAILNIIIYFGFFRQKTPARDFYDLLTPLSLLLIFTLVELTLVAGGRVLLFGSPFNFN
jgi:uncharacterized membrane protein